MNLPERPSLLPEEELLVAMAKLLPTNQDIRTALEALGHRCFSLNTALNLASRHGTYSILAYNMQQYGALYSQVGQQVHKRLSLGMALARQHNELYCKYAGPAFAFLSSSGVRVALMKGAALIATIYPPGTRLLSVDVDVLVERDDYPKVADALITAGFVKQIREGKSEAEELDSYHEITFKKIIAQRILTIDLHWLMCQRQCAFVTDTSAVLTRSNAGVFGGVPVLVLSMEDTFVQLAMQIANDDLEVSYQRITDIYAVARTGLEWERLCQVACDMRAMAITYFALRIAQKMGASIPGWVSDQLKRGAPDCEIVADFLADRRWFLQRSVIPACAKPWLLSSLQDRHTRDVIVCPFGFMQKCAKCDHGSFMKKVMSAARALVLILLWGAAFVAVAILRDVGAIRLSSRLNGALWKSSQCSRAT